MKAALLQLIKSLKDAFPDIIRQDFTEDVDNLIEFNIEANGLNNLSESEVKMLDPAILVDADHEKVLFEKHQFRDVNQCEYPTKVVKAVWNIAVRALHIITQVNKSKLAMVKCAANFANHNSFIMTNFNYLEHYYDSKHVPYPTYLIKIVDNKTLRVGKLLLLFLFQVIQDPNAFDCVPDISGFSNLIETAKREGKTFCNKSYKQLSEMIKKYNARLADRSSSTTTLTMPVDEIIGKNGELITYFEAILAQQQPIHIDELLINIGRFHFEADIQQIDQLIHNLAMGLTTQYNYMPRANANYFNEIVYLTCVDNSVPDELVFIPSEDKANESNTLETLREYLALMREQTDQVNNILRNLPNFVPTCIANKVTFYQEIIAIAEQLKNKQCALSNEKIIALYNNFTLLNDLSALKYFISRAEQNGAFCKKIANALIHSLTTLNAINDSAEHASNIIIEHLLQLLALDINSIQKEISESCRAQIHISSTDEEFKFIIAKINLLLTIKNKLSRDSALLKQKYVKCDACDFEQLNQISLEIISDINKLLAKLQSVVWDRYTLEPLPFKTIENEHQKTIVAQQIISAKKNIDVIKLILEFIEANFNDELIEIIKTINDALRINNQQLAVLTQMFQSYGDLENLYTRLAEYNQKIKLLIEQRDEHLKQRERLQKSKTELISSIQPCLDREQYINHAKQLSVQFNQLTNTRVEGVDIELISKLETDLNTARTERSNFINSQQSIVNLASLFITTLVSNYDPNPAQNALAILDTKITRLADELTKARQPLIQHETKCEAINQQILSLTQKIHAAEACITDAILNKFKQYKECVEKISTIEPELDNILLAIANTNNELEKTKQQIKEKINSLNQNLTETCEQFHAIICVLALQKLNAQEINDIDLETADILKNINFQNRHAILTLILNNDDTKNQHQYIEYLFKKIEVESNKISQCITLRHKLCRLHQFKIDTYNKFFKENLQKALLEKSLPPIKQSNLFTSLFSHLQPQRCRSASPTLIEQYGNSLLTISFEQYFQTLHQHFLDYVSTGSFELLKQTLLLGSQKYAEKNRHLDEKYRACMYDFVMNLSNIIFNEIEPHISSCYSQIAALTGFEIQKQKDGTQLATPDISSLTNATPSENITPLRPPNESTTQPTSARTASSATGTRSDSSSSSVQGTNNSTSESRGPRL